MMTRAAFLRLSAGLSAGWLMHAVREPSLIAAEQDGDMMEARAARAIEAYDSQGLHRTATDVDHRSADWLRDLAAGAGGVARLEPFAVSRVDVHRASVQVGSLSIEALPLFDGGFTDARELTGRLGAAGTDADFAVVVLDEAGISSEGQSLEGLRRSTAHRALVVATRGARPGLSPTNAVSFTSPYGIPALQVGSEHLARLEALARRRATARVIAYATRTQTEARNVVATVAGKQTGPPSLVVITPRSGWWRCAAERGGGIVCWLEALRAVATSAPDRTVLFVASSGHELGHLGLDSFLEQRPGIVKAAGAWLHLGANIGAAGGRSRLQSSNAAMAQMATDAMARATTEVSERVPIGTRPRGEARNIHDAGGRYVSLLGSSPFFHHPDDRWPAAVDLPVLVRFARAFADLAVALTRPSVP